MSHPFIHQCRLNNGSKCLGCRHYKLFFSSGATVEFQRGILVSCCQLERPVLLVFRVVTDVALTQWKASYQHVINYSYFKPAKFAQIINFRNNLLSGFSQGHRQAWANVPNRAMKRKKFISFARYKDPRTRTGRD